MASALLDCPPYIRLATVKGLVLLRRTISGLWAGRALRKLDLAKKGFLCDDVEALEWREVRNACVICARTSTLRVQWEGPGQLKPTQVDPGRAEFKGMTYLPVKVMDAYVCGVCRVVTLPRIMIITLWDLKGTTWSDCTCNWNGFCLSSCPTCLNLTKEGWLVTVGMAYGWQVRRYVDPLISLKVPDSEEGNLRAVTTMDDLSPGAVAPMTPPEPSLGAEAPLMPLEPPPYPGGVPCLPCAPSKPTREVQPIPKCDSLLEDAIRTAWPYYSSNWGGPAQPLGTIRYPLTIRVYRSPPVEPVDLSVPPPYTGEMVRKSDWEGPWELTTWGNLVREVINNPEIPFMDLPPVPQEEGSRETTLYYCATALDAWASNGARAKEKRAEFIVTPEAWIRDGVRQDPGTMAARVATPIRPAQSRKVTLSVMMVVVPFKGVYSVGADIQSTGPAPLAFFLTEEQNQGTSKTWPRPSFFRRWNWGRGSQ